MTFRPLLPQSGLAGWNLLNRTLEAQKSAQTSSPVLSREISYFRENIGKVSSAEDLVSNRTLLKVALGAFGLQDDLSNRFFIRKVLEEGVFNPDSLANKLADPRYAALSKSFGFGDLGIPNTRISTFPDRILEAYEDRSFEAAVGETNPDMRLALGLERELMNIISSASSEDARWFGVMGSPPLRAVFETAFTLPDSFAALDIDQQLKIFRDKASTVFGVVKVEQFTERDMLQQLRNRFLLLAEIERPQSSVVSAPVLGILSGSAGSASILSILYG